VSVEALDAGPQVELRVGSEFHVRARVRLGDLTPNDVRVQLYLGRVDADGDIMEAQATPMRPVGTNGESSYIFEASAVTCCKSGLHGYTVRVLPHHPDLTTSFLPGLIAWARLDGKTR
jgi:starch phosphorylase